jgi:hypothetical protein
VHRHHRIDQLLSLGGAALPRHRQCQQGLCGRYVAVVLGGHVRVAFAGVERGPKGLFGRRILAQPVFGLALLVDRVVGALLFEKALERAIGREVADRTRRFPRHLPRHARIIVRQGKAGLREFHKAFRKCRQLAGGRFRRTQLRDRGDPTAQSLLRGRIRLLGVMAEKLL